MSKTLEEFLEENALDTSFDDDESLPISEESKSLTEKEFKRIFTKIINKLSPLENWKTTLDEYEAQDQIKATIGKRYSIF